MKVIPE